MDLILSTPSKLNVTNEKMKMAKATVVIDMTTERNESDKEEQEDSMDDEKFIKRKSKRKNRQIVESSEEDDNQGERNELYLIELFSSYQQNTEIHIELESIKRRLLQSENGLRSTNKKISSVHELISLLQERIDDLEKYIPFSSIAKLR